jgi:hypothetical protein
VQLGHDIATQCEPPLRDCDNPDVSDPAIKQAYDEVRSGTDEITWLLITLEEDSDPTKWVLLAKGSGNADDLAQKVDFPTFIGFGYYRLTVIHPTTRETVPIYYFLKFQRPVSGTPAEAILNKQMFAVHKVITAVDSQCEPETPLACSEDVLRWRLNAHAGEFKYDIGEIDEEKVRRWRRGAS